jgi:hypothetical protein
VAYPAKGDNLRHDSQTRTPDDSPDPARSSGSSDSHPRLRTQHTQPELYDSTESAPEHESPEIMSSSCRSTDDLILTEIRDMHRDIKNMKHELHNDMRAMRQEIMTNSELLKAKLNEAEKEICQLKIKINRLEEREKSCNFIVYGIKEMEGKETWVQTEELIRNFLKQDLHINDAGDDTAVPIERASRLPWKSNDGSRPILVKFLREKHKNKTLEQAQLKLKKIYNFSAGRFYRNDSRAP